MKNQKQSMSSIERGKPRPEFLLSSFPLSPFSSLLTSVPFKNLLLDIVLVISTEDKRGLLKKNVVPTKFFEQDPAKITEAYLTFLEAQPKAAKTSISDKLAKSEYTSAYQFYHDIVVVSGHEIVKFLVGLDEYNSIDAFYKLTTELLLREVESLGLRLFEKEDAPADTLNLLRDDFHRISRNYSAPNGEVVMFMNKVEEPVAPVYHSLYSAQPTATKTTIQPLFSGLIGKSSLDARNTMVPDPYQLLKVLGTPKVLTNNSGTIKTFGNPASRIPGPALAPSQVLDSFFHPNWYTIEAPKWLIYKQKTLKPPVESTLVKNANSNELRTSEKRSQTVRSFGPNTDLRNTVLSHELKNSVWLNHIGFKELGEIRRKHLGSKRPPIDETVASTIALSEITPEAVAEKEAPAVEVAARSNQIKLENLVRFSPESVEMLEELKQDKDEIVKSPRDLQRIISASLLKLNKLRQERYLHSTASNALPGSSAEAAVYKKIVKLLTILVKSKSSSGCELALRLSKKLPVLLNDYPGVLPGPVPSKALPASKTGRLTGIRGPYKKKNRFV